MAIIFTTGTINQPDAGSVGLAMVEKIRDDVGAHSAWEFVEEFTPSGGAIRWYVFKCLAAGSGLPEDYYVIIGRTLSSGQLRAFVCEGYNTGTKTVSKFAPSTTSSLIAYDASGRSPATWVLGTSAPSGAGDQPNAIQWTPTGVASKWWITVDDDGFTVAFNGATNGCFHFGAYEPLNDSPAAMPIGYVSENNSGGITRNPAVAGISARGYALTAADQVRLGFLGRLDSNDALQGGQRAVAEVGIGLAKYDNPTMAILGYALGKYKRMRMGESATAPAGIAFGDAYVLDGRLWVPYMPTDHRMWDTGVAA